MFQTTNQIIMVQRQFRGSRVTSKILRCSTAINGHCTEYGAAIMGSTLSCKTNARPQAGAPKLPAKLLCKWGTQPSRKISDAVGMYSYIHTSYTDMV